MFGFGMKVLHKLRLAVFLGVVVISFKYVDIVANSSYRERLDVKEDFQLVTHEILVYSAYMEDRSRSVRVIGITSQPNNTQINCIFHYRLTGESLLVKGNINHIPESHRYRYTAAFFLCELPDVTKPDEVSVVDMITERSSDVISVRKITQQGVKHFVSACVSPLHSKFNGKAQLMEWIELNKILGVEKFIFYLNSVSKNVLRVLKYYESKGDVSLMPWTLPRILGDASNNYLHYYGQLAALNDCLYRSKGKSHYISSTDLDEFIIPQRRNDFSLGNLLSGLPSHSVYIVRCSFFSQRNGCSQNKICKKRLTVDSYKLRDDLILPPGKRSKYIAKTDDVTTMGVHFTWELRTGSEYTVSPEVALLHHYRREGKTYTKIAFTKIKHSVATKYIEKLHKSIDKVKTELSLHDNSTLIDVRF